MLGKDGPAPEASVFDHVGDWFGGLDGWLQTFILLATALGFVVAFLRWIKPRISAFFGDLRAIRDTLVGRPAMRDSITQRPIPGTAQPSIGDRMASQEVSMAKVAEAVDKLADASARLEDHEKRLSRVEDALHLDRRLEKIEAVQLLRTIETVAQAEPGDPAEGDRPD